MKALKKSAMAAALATGVMFGGTAQSYIIGPPGEALLYPFAYYVQGGGINTYLALHTSSFYGQDTVPNFFTAPHVWNAGNPIQPTRPVVHLFWFDYKSVEQYNTPIPVTLDDKYLINLEELGANIGHVMSGVPGYVVLIDQATRATPSPAASFIMMGDAALVANGNVTELPVMPMPDGPDVAGTPPTNTNNCVYDPVSRTPICTPITPGTRRDNDDPIDDVVVVDIELAPLAAQLQTLIVWQDQNYVDILGNPIAGAVAAVDRFDIDEEPCSDSITLPWEVSVVVLEDPFWPLPGVGWWGQAPAGAALETLCVPPVAAPNLVGNDPGILRMYLKEGDTGVVGDGPNSALVAFTITATDQTAAPTGLVTHLGHDLGKGQP
jgi:hypothetical protein